MDDFTKDIHQVAGDWSEAQFGDWAVVRLRADTRTVEALSSIYRPLSETEARKAPTSRPLSQLVREVPAEMPSKELLAIGGRWRAVGFSKGWRLPAAVVAWAVGLGLEPDRYGAAVGYLHRLYGRDLAGLYDYLLQTGGRFADLQSLLSRVGATVGRLVTTTIAGGAFGDTGVKDNFDRANENPLSDGGKWSMDLLPTLWLNDLQVLTNVCASAGAGVGSGWRNDATYGPDAEVFFDISTKGGTGDQGFGMLRIASPGTTGVDGYDIYPEDIAGGANDEQSIGRVIDEARVQLGAVFVNEIASGDAFGLDAIGTALAGYRKPSGGSWAQLGTRTDTNISAAGNIGLAISGTTIRKNNFGGGTVVAAVTESDVMAMSAGL